MKYKIMVDVSFTDKLDETIQYQPGDIIETPVNEKRKENIIARGLGHVVEEVDTTDKTKDKGKGKGKGKGKKEEIVEPTTEEEPITEETTTDEEEPIEEIVEETIEEVEPTTEEK